MTTDSCKGGKKGQAIFKMKGTVCAKRERCEQENSSGSMMLERVEVGGEAIKMYCAGQC